MVDAAASFDGKGLAPGKAMPPKVASGVIATAVSTASPEALAAYDSFCRTALFSPAQSGLWVRHWADTLRPDAIFATASLDGSPLLALALEVERSGPFRIARFMGGRHANGNFAPVDPARPQALARGTVRLLFDAIAAARPDVDLVALQRLTPELEDVPNPLAALPGFASPNLSLAVDLSGGFEAVLARSSGRRKRKKNRSQMRKFETAGGVRRIEATSRQEVRELLDAFFAMKEARFRRMGIANVFGEAQVRAFFHALFAAALAEKVPPFVVHGLEVGGTLRAVTGSSRSQKRLICEFSSIAEDEMAFASPGDFLFFANIEEACGQGLDVYDFSVGDEPYKRQWCDLETQHLDVLVPLTTKGRVLALLLQQNARLKSFIKSNPTIWTLTKNLRRKAAGRQPAKDDG
ncbi:MAG TPA: GNAT family N-acetyltransferase [Mesorhizobium sp.]|nr:GNAT family N-acetyltransferase [Mesorhizobium sp.]